jgi:8-oxo-dGTP pyrophosphatase MutT (NUDIX family)
MNHDNAQALARMNALARELLADPGYLELPNLRPRDAAALILIDGSGPVTKVLLGRRHDGHKFMPGKFVFPGGRVEPADRRMETARPLDPHVERQLMREVGSPSAAHVRALALAAIRETCEETGLLLGRPAPTLPSSRSRIYSTSVTLKGDRTQVNLSSVASRGPPGSAWAAFAAARVLPDLGALHFVARAITPPRRTRRFDTRFFAADTDAIAHRIDGVTGPDTELVELVWLPIGEARALDLAAITGVVLQELEARIAAGLARDLPVPFYRMRHRRFVRELL